MENNTKNKNVLVTGATGGIGGAITKILSENGYTIYAPVRDTQKAEVKFADSINKQAIVFAKCNVENAPETKSYIESLISSGIEIGTVILSAGTLKFDDEFATVDESIKANSQANLVTKENIIMPLLDIKGDLLKKTNLFLFGSQAANFEVGHPWRVNEEGYVQSHQGVMALGKRLLETGKFAGVHVAEPALVDTPLTREKFALDDSTGLPRDWSKVPTENEFALSFLIEAGLI